MIKPFTLVPCVLLSLVTGLAGEQENSSPSESDLLRKVSLGEVPETTRLSRFHGSVDSLRWRILGENSEPFDLLLDLHQVAGSRAIPVGEGVVLGEGLTGRKGAPAEVGYRLPELASDRPIRFLFRLWRRRPEGQVLIDSVLLSLEPPGTLEALGNLAIQLRGFDEEPKWLAPLREAGVAVESSKRVVEVGNEAKNLLWILEAGSEVAAFENRDGRRIAGKIIRFEKSAESPAWKAGEDGSAGWILTLPAGFLDTLGVDPDLQRRFAGWIMKGPEASGEKREP